MLPYKSWGMKRKEKGSQVWTQLNTYGRLWSNMVDSALHLHQNTKREIILWTNAVSKAGKAAVYTKSLNEIKDLFYKRDLTSKVRVYKTFRSHNDSSEGLRVEAAAWAG